MVFFQQDAYSSTLPAQPRKYNAEPDWAPAPQPRPVPQSQYDARSAALSAMPHPQRQYDARDASLSTLPAHGNVERRDVPAGMPFPSQIDRETQSYVAAIKAVNDSTNGTGVDGALRGLWRVFDAGVGELGAQLNDSLSSKATFEACVNQEKAAHQGKTVNQAEKNADAANRRTTYQSNLRSTMLRLRGSFADVLLGVAKDMQDSNNRRIAEIETRYRTQMEKMEETVREKVQGEIQKDLQSDIQSKLNQELGRVKEQAESEILRARGSADDKVNQANVEIGRLSREMLTLRKDYDAEINRLLGELQASRHEADMEKSRLHQELKSLEHEKDDAVNKLSTTLETLQSTCVSSQGIERKLLESEDMIQRALNTQKELRERAGLESERAMLLQNKLQSEVESKEGLSRIKAEIEQHLRLERERADLLQQELESQKHEQQNWLEELAQVSTMNVQLRDQLKNATEAGSLLNKKVDQIQPRLDQYSNALGKMSDKCAKLEATISEAHSDNVQLAQSLNDLKEENANLESMLSQVNGEKHQLAKALAKSQEGMENLLITVDKAKTENSELAALLNEAKNDNTQLANALNGLDSEKTQLSDILEEARSNQARLLKEIEEAKHQVEERDRMNTELTNNYAACVEALGAAKDDTIQLSSMLDTCKGDLDKKSELNSLLDAEVTRLETRLQELTTENSELAENVNACKDHIEKEREANSVIASKVAKLEATVEDQLIELQAAKLSEADVESSLADSIKKNEELSKKLDGTKYELQLLTEKLRDEVREKNMKADSLNEATQLLNDFERIIKELEDRSKEKSAELNEMSHWNANLQSERDSLLERIQTFEETHIEYEKSLNEKNELLNEMSEVVETLKEHILAVERDSSEKLRDVELTALEQSQEAQKVATETIQKLEHDYHRSNEELRNANVKVKELQTLNDCLESECDSLRDKIDKAQDEFNTDRDKIAGALLGFDEEMTNAEAKIKSVLDELELEKKKGQEISTKLSEAEKVRDTIMGDIKSLQDKCSSLESECKLKQAQLDEWDKKQADREHELSVYQEAIKMLQERVDKAYESNSNTNTDSSSQNSKMDTLQQQLDKVLQAQNNKKEGEDEEIISLKEKLIKEKSRLGRLQKLCFNAKQDLSKLQDQKEFLETSLKQSIKFIKQLKGRDNDIAAESNIVTTKAGVMSNFDQICLPLDIGNVSNGTTDYGELQKFLSSVENQMTCNEGENASDHLMDLMALNSW